MGWRLVAVDGSTVQVPNTPENLAHFGAWQPAKGAPCPMARISQMFDVLNDVTLEALIVPRVGESENWPPTIFLIYTPVICVIGPWLPRFLVVCPDFE